MDPVNGAVEALFRPRSVAIVGASESMEKAGGRTLKYLREDSFGGSLFPVHPVLETVQGITAYRGLLHIPLPVDLVIVAVPAGDVASVLREACAVKAKAAIIYSSGFREEGKEGAEREELVKEALSSGRLRALGPNCQGVVNARNRMRATFSTAWQSPWRGGRLALATQSGAAGGYLRHLLQDLGCGFALWASAGNQIDITLSELVEYYAESDSVDVIGVIVEAVPDVTRMAAAVETARQRGIPCVVLYPGASEASQRAARFHTGAIASNRRVAVGVLRQAGAILVESISELAAVLAMCAADRGARSLTVDREKQGVGLVTTSGGIGVMMADQLSKAGFQLAELSDRTKSELSAILPTYAAIGNPVDTTYTVVLDGSVVGRIARALLSDKSVGVAMVFMTLIRAQQAEIIDSLVAASTAVRDKSIVVIWSGGLPDGVQRLRDASVLVFEEIDGVISAFKRLPVHRQASDSLVESLRPPVAYSAGTASRLEQGLQDLYEPDVYRLFKGVGLAVAPWQVVASESEVASAYRALGPVVVMKGIARGRFHKAREGLVHMNIESLQTARRCWSDLAARFTALGGSGWRILVQKQISARYEVLLSYMSHEKVGPMVVLGSGGVNAEDHGDAVMRRLPIGPDDVVDLTWEWAETTGIRFEKGELEQLQVTVGLFSRLALDVSDVIAQLEVNPLLFGAGVAPVAVDGRGTIH